MYVQFEAMWRPKLSRLALVKYRPRSIMKRYQYLRQQSFLDSYSSHGHKRIQLLSIAYLRVCSIELIVAGSKYHRR